MTWLITGGAGYIGSHVTRRLRDAGHAVVVFDDLSSGNPGRVPSDVPLWRGDLTDRQALVAAMSAHQVSGVVNLAARKRVTESVDEPLWYYRENVGGFLCLLAAMADAQVRLLVQSSTAAVYGAAPGPVLSEDSLTVPLSPYAATKLMAERILADCASTAGLSYVVLRYFNPMGAEAPELAEAPAGGVSAVLFDAVANDRIFEVTGGDFRTRDGSGLRDYIHISDLTDAHVAAVEYVSRRCGGEIVNIGTGQGHTVLELLATTRMVTGRPVRHRVVARRPGDPDGAVAETGKAARLLGWRARRDLKETLDNAWTMWQAHHAAEAKRHDQSWPRQVIPVAE
jgi:UDP-glucose 4-epimerase